MSPDSPFKNINPTTHIAFSDGPIRLDFLTSIIAEMIKIEDAIRPAIMKVSAPS